MASHSPRWQKGSSCLRSPLVRGIGLALLANLLGVLFPHVVLAQQTPYAAIARLTGTVIVRSQVTPPVGQWRHVTELNYPLYTGDEIKTNSGTAKIVFTDDGSLIALDEETVITLEEGSKRRTILGMVTDEYLSRTIRVTRGWVGGAIRERRDLVTEFESPTVVARAQGTALSFAVDPTTGVVTITSTAGVLDVLSLGGSTLIELSDGAVEVSVDPLTGAINVTAVSGSHEVQTETGVIVSLDAGEGARLTIGPAANTIEVTATVGVVTADVGGNTVTLDEDECFQAVVEPTANTVEITATCGEIDVNGTLLAEGQTGTYPFTTGPAPPPGPPPEPIPPERLETTDASPSS